ncbi:hypothetical protein [Schaalia turicensis]|uniref:hypothetical protein n=1 Tax=Schaalia turicensis TaxID=131111 RepID=UPI0036C86ACD
MKILFDTCSLIHFLASSEQLILSRFAHAARGELTVPEKVCEELRRVLSRKQKFARTPALDNWRAFEESVTVLSDDTEETSFLEEAMTALNSHDLMRRRPLRERLALSEDVGEFIVASHALALALQGERVIVVIDDEYGRGLVATAQQFLLAHEAISKGRIDRSSTSHIVKLAEKKGLLGNRAASAVFEKMEEIENIRHW